MHPAAWEVSAPMDTLVDTLVDTLGYRFDRSG